MKAFWNMSRSAVVLVTGLALAAGCELVIGTTIPTLEATTGTGGTSSGTGGTGGATTSSASSSSSSGEMCDAGSPCYTGPTGTEGVGLCMGGTATCEADGGAGACMGEVLPSLEMCADTKDENCDGFDCVEWAELFSDGATVAFEDVATDASGNIIAVGVLFGAITIGGNALTDPGGGNALIVKLAPTGQPMWAQAFGDTGAQGARGVAVDSEGNVLVAGCTQTTFMLNGMAVPAGDFVMKLSADGQTFHWLQSLGTGACMSNGGSFGAVGNVAKIAVTSTDDVLTAGSFTSSLSLGTTAGLTKQAVGTTDGFIALLQGSNGAGTWLQTFGSPGQQQVVNDVAYTALNVIAVGDFSGTIKVGSSSATSTQPGGSNAFVVSLLPDGSTGSVVALSDGSGSSAYNVGVLDGAGDYAVSGVFAGTVNFGVNSATAPSSSLSTSYFVVFDSLGEYQWSTTYNGSSTDIGADPKGNIVLAGFFDGSLTFGTQSLMAPSGDTDVFLAKLDPKGNQLWAKSFDAGSGILPILGRMRVLPTGEEAVAGLTRGAVNFGTGVLTPTGIAGFVAKFGF